jgi:hypothetical protein
MSYPRRMASCGQDSDAAAAASGHAGVEERGLTAHLGSRTNSEPGAYRNTNPLILWRSGILQKLINVALDLLHLGQEFGARSLIQLQQDYGELRQR